MKIKASPFTKVGWSDSGGFSDTKRGPFLIQTEKLLSRQRQRRLKFWLRVLWKRTVQCRRKESLPERSSCFTWFKLGARIENPRRVPWLAAERWLRQGGATGATRPTDLNRQYFRRHPWRKCYRFYRQFTFELTVAKLSENVGNDL